MAQHTNTASGAADLPEALRSIQRFEVVDCIDDKHVPAVIPKPHGPWVRYEDHIAALAAWQADNAQPAAPASDLAAVIKGAADKLDAAPQPSTTAQAAESVPAPVPPPECETEAEKRAFAFGWFKALESERMKADSVLEDAAQESEYRRGYRHGYEQRDAEVRGAMA